MKKKYNHKEKDWVHALNINDKELYKFIKDALFKHLDMSKGKPMPLSETIVWLVQNLAKDFSKQDLDAEDTSMRMFAAGMLYQSSLSKIKDTMTETVKKKLGDDVLGLGDSGFAEFLGDILKGKKPTGDSGLGDFMKDVLKGKVKGKDGDDFPSFLAKAMKGEIPGIPSFDAVKNRKEGGLLDSMGILKNALKNEKKKADNHLIFNVDDLMESVKTELNTDKDSPEGNTGQ